jgi:hypothetical protein
LFPWRREPLIIKVLEIKGLDFGTRGVTQPQTPSLRLRKRAINLSRQRMTQYAENLAREIGGRHNQYSVSAGLAAFSCGTGVACRSGGTAIPGCTGGAR